MPINRREHVMISNETDIVKARRMAHDLCQELNFRERDQVRLTTAISELVRNVVKYAQNGECAFFAHRSERTCRVEAIISDTGPGIANIDKALMDGYSSSGTLGIGLPGTRKIVDEFHLANRENGVQVFIAVHSEVTS